MAEQQINIPVIELFNSGSSIPGSDVFYGAILDAGALGQKPVETRPADKLDPRGEGGSVQNSQNCTPCGLKRRAPDC